MNAAAPGTALQKAPLKFTDIQFNRYTFRLKSNTFLVQGALPSVPYRSRRGVGPPIRHKRRKLCTGPDGIVPPMASPQLAATTAIFTGSTILALSLTVLMVVFPQWHRTRQLVSSTWPLILMSLAYGVLLAWSWQPDTFALILPGSLADGLENGWSPQFFPKLDGIMTLFSRVPTAASLWVHLLAINVSAAREIYLDGGFVF